MDGKVYINKKKIKKLKKQHKENIQKTQNFGVIFADDKFRFIIQVG